MTTTQLEKLLFAQGGKCFFCRNTLEKSQASVEHLVAKANGGTNLNNENCVACCKAINSLLGSMSIKQKIEIILNQEGKFICPSKSQEVSKPAPCIQIMESPPPPSKEQERLHCVISNLKKRGNSRPKKVKTLESTILSIPQLKGIKAPEVKLVIEKLKSSGKISVNGEAVTYSL